MSRPICRRLFGAVLSVALFVCSFAPHSEAATGGTPAEPSKTTGTPGSSTNPPGSTTSPNPSPAPADATPVDSNAPHDPNAPPPDQAKPYDPEKPDEAKDQKADGYDKLPDAMAILDFLRSIPWPGSGGGGSIPEIEYPGDDSFQVGPARTTSGGGAAPKRTVNVAANQPFVPRPAPRPAAAPPAPIADTAPAARPREVIVTLNQAATSDTVFELGQDMGLEGDTLYTSSLLGIKVVRFRIPDTRSVPEVLTQLASDVRVNAAQPNYVFVANQGAAKPAPLPVPQYAPDKLHLDAAHKVALGKRVKVAVIDTAADVEHPALLGAVSETFDALGETPPVAEAHGTAIAGILGARAELEGVAPGSEMLVARAFAADASNGAPQSNSLALVRALDWSVASGARVVNMSFAGPDDPLLGKAIEAAIGQGVVIVAAAGNGGPSAKPAYPGAFPGVIAVTATDSSDATYRDANRGPYIAVAAPGVDIVAAAPDGAYDITSGTSMAAAHVSGIAALMLEKDPQLTPDALRKKLEQSARKAGGAPATEVGAGIADAARALNGL